MFNIGKLAGEGSPQYYLDKVARGVEDYYLHAGEGSFDSPNPRC